MRISKRKINFAKYGGRYKIWIKPYRTRMRMTLKHYYEEHSQTPETDVKSVLLQIPKYRIVERRGKFMIRFFANTVPIKR